MAFQSLDIVEEIFNYLDNKVDPIDERIKQLEELIKNRFEAKTFTSYLVADLPTPVGFQVAYATNGRKSGEGAGLGTGVPVWYDVNSASWLKYDETVVQD